MTSRENEHRPLHVVAMVLLVLGEFIHDCHMKRAICSFAGIFWQTVAIREIYSLEAAYPNSNTNPRNLGSPPNSPSAP